VSVDQDVQRRPHRCRRLARQRGDGVQAGRAGAGQSEQPEHAGLVRAAGEGVVADGEAGADGEIPGGQESAPSDRRR
jgi:hypothetical protein